MAMRYDAGPVQMDVEARLRRLILALLSIGLVGTGVELIALAHYEDQWQLVPLFVISIALIAVVMQAFTGSAVTVGLLRTVALVMIATGAAGVILHYRGNLEFQLETNPDLSGMALFKRIVSAKAPPALAPGVMAQLGLLALIYCFKHPLLRSSK